MIFDRLITGRKEHSMDEAKKDVVTVAEENLEIVVGGGAFDDVPRVDEHDYDDDTRKKA